MENQEDYVTEALELLDGISAEIQPPRTSIIRQNGMSREIEHAAFVKLSTAFKKELATISGEALKIWIFIALSINRANGLANPSLRTIAKGTGYGVNTVQAALKELEIHDLLSVDRESRRYNIYEPSLYVSANRQDPVSQPDTVSESASVSEKAESVSEKQESVSDHREDFLLNQRNQSKPDRVKSLANANLDWQLAAGMSSAEIAAGNAEANAEAELLHFYEAKMGYGTTLDWWKDEKSDLADLRKFLLTKSRAEIEGFAKWCRRPFSKFSPENALRWPRQVMTLWPLAETKETEPEQGHWL